MRWMHLSDIHLNNVNNTALSKRVKDTLLEFLQKSKIFADYLFITGDFRYAKTLGSENSVEVARKIAIYIRSIAEAIGVHERNIHLVPGNHDLSRGKGDDEMIEKEIFPHYDEMNDKFTEEQKNYLINRFNFFYTVNYFVHDINYDCRWIDEIHYTVSEENFDILHLNTALICNESRNNEDLLIGGGILQAAMENIADNEKKTLFILGHHKLEAIHIRDREYILRSVDKRPVFYLYGHEHLSESSIKNNIWEIGAGAILHEKEIETNFCIGEVLNNGLLSTLNFFKYRIEYKDNIEPMYDWEADELKNQLYRDRIRDSFIKQFLSSLSDVKVIFHFNDIKNFFNSLSEITPIAGKYEKSLFRMRLLWCFDNWKIIDKIKDMAIGIFKPDKENLSELNNMLKERWNDTTSIYLKNKQRFDELVGDKDFRNIMKRLILEFWKNIVMGEDDKKYENKDINFLQKFIEPNFIYNSNSSDMIKFFEIFNEWEKDEDKSIFILYGEKGIGKKTVTSLIYNKKKKLCNNTYIFIYIECNEKTDIIKSINDVTEIAFPQISFFVVIDNFEKYLSNNKIHRIEELEKYISQRKDRVKLFAIYNQYVIKEIINEQNEINEMNFPAFDCHCLMGFDESEVLKFIQSENKRILDSTHIGFKDNEYKNPLFLEILCENYDVKADKRPFDYILDFIEKVYDFDYKIDIEMIMKMNFSNYFIRIDEGDADEEYENDGEYESDEEYENDEEYGILIEDYDTFISNDELSKDELSDDFRQSFLYLEDDKYYFNHRFVCDYLRYKYFENILESDQNDEKRIQAAKFFRPSNRFYDMLSKNVKEQVDYIIDNNIR